MELNINFNNDSKRQKLIRRYKTPANEKLYSLFLKASTGLGFLTGGATTFALILERFAEFELAVVSATFWGIGFLSRFAYKSLKTKHQELELLDLMLANHGMVSIPEAAIALSVKSEKAESLINSLHEKGFLTLDVSDNGNMIYRLTNYEAPEQNLNEGNNQGDLDGYL